MTVGELIGELEQFDEDAEVRLAMQPSWPFEYSIGQVVSGADAHDDPDDEPDIERVMDGFVYIAEERQVRYLPGAVKNLLGWRGYR